MGERFCGRVINRPQWNKKQYDEIGTFVVIKRHTFLIAITQFCVGLKLFSSLSVTRFDANLFILFQFIWLKFSFRHPFPRFMAKGVDINVIIILLHFPANSNSNFLYCYFFNRFFHLMITSVSKNVYSTQYRFARKKSH